MVKVRIIPCLDVKDGRVVKGINFLDLIDAGDPVEQARHYSENGADDSMIQNNLESIKNLWSNKNFQALRYCNNGTIYDT